MIWVGGHLPEIKENLARRGVDSKTIESTLKHLEFLLEARRIALVQEEMNLAEKNRLSQGMKALSTTSEEFKNTRNTSRVLGEAIEKFSAQRKQAEHDLEALLASVPNILDSSVPTGTEDASVEVLRWGTPRSVAVEPRDHVAVAERLGWLDTARAARLSGARFSVLWGGGAALARALGQWMVDFHTRTNGYTEVAVPFLVRPEALHGTAQLPKFEADLFHLDPETSPNLYLIPTGEVPLTNLHGDEILDDATLPRRYVTLTPCFRAEAGAAGRDTRGLLRQHRFDKVELVRLERPADSAAALERLVEDAEGVLRALNLPYRKILLSSQDTGFSATKTYDLEVWLPGSKTYREISSCSHCGDFQARRIGLRYRPTPTAKPQFLHTLNGSGLAVGRTWVAVLENYQQADGSVLVPEVLRPYLGGLVRLTP
jgi:seryl-tRNA synthetase